jgi:hypothetical protein
MSCIHSSRARWNFRVLGLILGLLVSLGAHTASAQTTRFMVMEDDVGVIKALRYGATPTARTSATLQAALTALGSGRKTLVLSPGTWDITSNLTIPATLTLWLPAGTTMTIAGGSTVTVLGTILIDGCGAFAGAGTILLPKVMDLNVCWFGTVGDLSADDTPAVQRAADSMAYLAPGGTSPGLGCCAAVLRFPAGSFRLNSTVTLKGGGTVVGAGPANTFLVDYSTTGNMLVTTAVVGDKARWTFRDMTLTASAAKTGGAALLASTPAPTTDAAQVQLAISNIWCLHHYTCFSLLNSIYGHITDNHLSNIRGVGMLVHTFSNPDAGDLVVAHNVFGGSVGTGTGLGIQTNGIRVLGNKFLGLAYGIEAHPATTFPLADLLIANNSLENQDQYAILIQTGAADKSGVNIHINSNQIGLLQGGTTNALIALSGALSNITINGNVLGVTRANSAAILLAEDGFGNNPNLFMISSNTITGNNASNSSGILTPAVTDLRGMVSGNWVSGVTYPYFNKSAMFLGGPVLFSTLVSFGAAGSSMYCADCTVASGADNTCAGSGTGAQAIKIVDVFRCFKAQN